MTCTHAGLVSGESVTLQVVTRIVDTDFAVIENSATVAALGLTAEPITINNGGTANLTLAALPATGSTTDVVLPIALVLLVVGSGMVFVARRREDEAH